jgi:hypothetical protein
LNEQLVIAIPILVGLAAVGLAMLERGYKRYLEEKKIAEAEGKTLTFDMAYIVNMVVSTGVSSAIISVIPVLVEQIGKPTEITFVSLLLNAILGYTTAYTVLDKMNQKTDSKIETAKAIKESKQ